MEDGAISMPLVRSWFLPGGKVGKEGGAGGEKKGKQKGGKKGEGGFGKRVFEVKVGHFAWLDGEGGSEEVGVAGLAGRDGGGEEGVRGLTRLCLS